MQQTHAAVQAADYYAMASLYWASPRNQEVLEAYNPAALRMFLEEGYRLIALPSVHDRAADEEGAGYTHQENQESYIQETLSLLPSDSQEIISFYARYFAPAHARKGAPLIESVYRPWTQDETNMMPFKHDTGYVMGDSALYMQDVLAKLELEISAQVMPDDLCVELSVASMLCEYAPAADVQDFLMQRFSWLPQLAARIKREAGRCVHARLVDQLIFVNATLVARLASE